MAPTKLKQRRGAKNKKGKRGGCSLKLLVGVFVIIVMGIMTLLLGGMQDALQRQRDKFKVLAHGSLRHALTRPPFPSNVAPKQAELQQKHELSQIQQAEEMKRRIEEQHQEHMEHVVNEAADKAVYNAMHNQGDMLQHQQNHFIRGGNHNNNNGNMQPKLQEPKLPPAEQLGGPYPYSLELPPDDYDIHASYEPLGGFRFAEYTSGDAPYQITDDIRQKSDALARKRRVYIKQMMKFAWDNYAANAMGMDEIKPVSGRGDQNWGGMGVQLVDCLDTLWLLGMKDEFWAARDWVRDHLTSNVNRMVSVFETTIRSLGGLLAAYDWSGDKVFLEKAIDLGQRLGRSYEHSTTGLPYGQVHLANGKSNNIQWARGNVILSEFGSMQLEYRMLDECAKTPETADLRRKSEHVFEQMNAISPPNGLFPYYLSNNDPDGRPKFRNDHLTFGAMADSFYEYMLKVWIQGGKVEPMYRAMYDKAMQGMHDELVKQSRPSGLTFIADKIGGSRYDDKMDHLVCFMGGLLALGAYTDPQGLDSPRAQRDLKTGRALTYTCYQMYARMETGISAEFVQFRQGEDFRIGAGAPHYLLRPETVESFFILNQLTGDPVYREWGWEVFQSIEKYCRTQFGYGTLSTVQNKNQQPRDKMETFFLAETVKYLYLLQDPDTEVDVLNKHVFNTEAHPMRVFNVLNPDSFKANQ